MISFFGWLRAWIFAGTCAAGALGCSLGVAQVEIQQSYREQVSDGQHGPGPTVGEGGQECPKWMLGLDCKSDLPLWIWSLEQWAASASQGASRFLEVGRKRNPSGHDALSQMRQPKMRKPGSLIPRDRKGQYARYDEKGPHEEAANSSRRKPSSGKVQPGNREVNSD